MRILTMLAVLCVCAASRSEAQQASSAGAEGNVRAAVEAMAAKASLDSDLKKTVVAGSTAKGGAARRAAALRAASGARIVQRTRPAKVAGQ